MNKYISIGKYNNNLKYLFLSSFFLLLTNFFFGIYFNNNFEILQFFKTKTQETLFHNLLIHELFRNIVILISSLIIFQTQKLENNDSDNQLSFFFPIKLIYTNQKKTESKKNSPSYILFTIFLWIIQRFLMDMFYLCGLRDLDYWMLELIFVSNLYSEYHKAKTYKHQKFGIYFNTIVCGIMKMTSFLISFIGEKNKENLAYKEYKWLIPVGIISYLIIMLLRAYVNCSLCWIMEIKYLSPARLLVIYGMLGTLFYLVICTIFTFISYKPDKEKGEFIFHVTKDNETFYFDNFEIYYKILKNDTSIVHYTNKAKEVIFEILVNIFGTITNFWNIWFYVLVIKYLTPIHIIFSNSFYYFVLQIIFLFYINDIKENKKSKVTKHIIDIFEDLFSLFGYLVYLELIELNFKGLNYNLRRKINERSQIDSQLTLLENIINDNNDNTEDKNKQNSI